MHYLIHQNPHLEYQLQTQFNILQNKHVEFINDVYKKIDSFANDDDHVHMHEWDEYQEHFFEHHPGLEEEFDEHKFTWDEFCDALVEIDHERHEEAKTAWSEFHTDSVQDDIDESGDGDKYEINYDFEEGD